MSNNSVSLHRVLKTSPEKVFRAFTEPTAMASWLPPYGFTCTVHEMEAKTGGTFRMSFHNFSTGNGHSFGGTYLEIKPNEYLKYTDKFDDPNLPGEMITTAVFDDLFPDIAAAASRPAPGEDADVTTRARTLFERIQTGTKGSSLLA